MEPKLQALPRQRALAHVSGCLWAARHGTAGEDICSSEPGFLPVPLDEGGGQDVAMQAVLQTP